MHGEHIFYGFLDAGTTMLQRSGLGVRADRSDGLQSTPRHYRSIPQDYLTTIEAAWSVPSVAIGICGIRADELGRIVKRPSITKGPYPRAVSVVIGRKDWSPEWIRVQRRIEPG